MKDKPPRRLLRWLVRGGLVGGLLLFVGFAGSNLFLSSNLGQKFLQKNLNRRTPGLAWEISGATWSPWNGITVKELSARVKEPSGEPSLELLPLLTLRETELKPYWGQLLRGKKLFREILVEEPVLNIPLEGLLVVAPSQPAPLPEPTPKVQPKPKPSDRPEGPETAPPKKPTAAKPKAPSKAKPKPKPKAEPVAPDEKRFWLRIRNARVRLYSLKHDAALELHSLDANLPLAGPQTQGKLSWEKVTLMGQPLIAGKTLAIDWKHPHWTLPNEELTLRLPAISSLQAEPPAFKVMVGGLFQLRGKGHNFRFNAALPNQPFPDYLIHHSSRFHLSAQSVASRFAGRGRLLEPNTWQFNSSLALDELAVFSELRERHLSFDTARAELQLRRSTLVLPSFALRSERASVMGNGQLHLGGYLLAVARLVADPEFNERLTNLAIGSNITGGWTSSWLRPLETPDRYYRDLHFEGFLPEVKVNTHKKDTFIPLADAVRLLQSFTAREVLEELPESS